MSSLKTIWEVWHPETQKDRREILLELEKVLANPHFRNSKRYPALLRYVVESTLAGNADMLKERTLGVEVFHRSPSYDTNTDTVVRYTAGEVRKRLLLYYHEHEQDSRIQISLPAGSYVPEFLCSPIRPGEELHSGTPLQHSATTVVFTESIAQEASTPSDRSTNLLLIASPAQSSGSSPAERANVRMSSNRLWRLSMTVLVILAIVVGWQWWVHAVRRPTALDEFWAPVLHEQGTTLICSGSVVFAPNNFSGVTTAGKDIEYSFVSIQIAAAIAKISGLLERGGATYQMQPSASTPLTEMRERPVILLGGYNNEWTLRLLSPLRFQFTPEPFESIVDREHPQVHWSRDHSHPYSSADDYALVARFRDTNTGSVVVVLAGLGRNGTEAAAQFVTSPHYMQLLKEQMNGNSMNKNIEAVLKISVVEGKTGAPSIQAVYVW
jgi:hypothetical protein